MSRKKKWITALCASLLLLSFSVVAPHNASATKFLSFGTGSPAGTYYFIGAGFAAIINKFVPGVRVTAESTAASTENARLLIRGQLDLGLACMGTLADLKKQGMDVGKVKLVAVGHTSDTHWIVRKILLHKVHKRLQGQDHRRGSGGQRHLEHLLQKAPEGRLGS